jgi:hypothetical protein
LCRLQNLMFSSQSRFIWWRCTISWNVTPGSPIEVNRYFRETYCLHLQVEKWVKQVASSNFKDGGDMLLRNVGWLSTNQVLELFFEIGLHGHYVFDRFMRISISWNGLWRFYVFKYFMRISIITFLTDISVLNQFALISISNWFTMINIRFQLTLGLNSEKILMDSQFKIL